MEFCCFAGGRAGVHVAAEAIWTGHFRVGRREVREMEMGMVGGRVVVSCT